MRNYSIAAVLAMLLASVGCNTLTFTVVDAKTGKPLQGVAVARHSYIHDPLGQSLFDRDETADCGVTNADGKISLTLNPRLVNAVFFKYDDYTPARATWGGGKEGTAPSWVWIASPDDPLHPSHGESVPRKPVLRLAMQRGT